MKRWKIASSLALPAAVVLSLVAGTWKLKPSGWHPLTVHERDSIVAMAKSTSNCTQFKSSDAEAGKLICTICYATFVRVDAMKAVSRLLGVMALHRKEPPSHRGRVRFFLLGPQ